MPVLARRVGDRADDDQGDSSPKNGEEALFLCGVSDGADQAPKHERNRDDLKRLAPLSDVGDIAYSDRPTACSAAARSRKTSIVQPSPAKCVHPVDEQVDRQAGVLVPEMRMRSTFSCDIARAVSRLAFPPAYANRAPRIADRALRAACASGPVAESTTP